MSARSKVLIKRAGRRRGLNIREVHKSDDQWRAALFVADTKFESGTDWPSFTDAMADNVELRRDFRLGLPRTEVLCRRCGGHLGHVFGDGPGPTGQRYCINAFALASDRG